ncbi:MAG: TauD/TfdA family dioxygenase [Pseudomonadota bacterium]
MQIIDAPPGGIGAELVNVDVRQLDGQSEEIGQIRDAIYRNKLLAIRKQELTTQEYLEFTRKVGTPQVYFQPQYHHPEHPEIFVSTNMLEKGKKVGVSGTGRYWHTDCQFETSPLPFTSIRPLVFPREQRGTYYMDMVKIYQELPDDLRTFLDAAVAIHEGKMRYKIQASDIDLSLAEILDRVHHEVPPVRHPAVIRHPVTQERMLYMSSGFTTKIEGLSHEENEALMSRVFSFCEQERFVHLHAWEKDDLIIWDNRSLNHKSTGAPPGTQSKSYRIGIYDHEPFYEGIAS